MNGTFVTGQWYSRRIASLFVVVLHWRTLHSWNSRLSLSSSRRSTARNSGARDDVLVVPPRTNQDWTDLSKLLVAVFDETEQRRQNSNDDEDRGFLRVKKLWWHAFEKPALQEYVYRQYVQTARSMRKRKYAILLAKKKSGNNQGNTDDDGAVVGMAELGLVDAKRPTVGVLCVDSEARHQGVGSKLLDCCESIVVNQWNQTVCYVEVEDTNKEATEFFQRQGYETRKDADAELRMVQVRKGRRLELRPHRVLSKRFGDSNS